MEADSNVFYLPEEESQYMLGNFPFLKCFLPFQEEKHRQEKWMGHLSKTCGRGSQAVPKADFPPDSDSVTSLKATGKPTTHFAMLSFWRVFKQMLKRLLWHCLAWLLDAKLFWSSKGPRGRECAWKVSDCQRGGRGFSPQACAWEHPSSCRAVRKVVIPTISLHLIRRSLSIL